MWYSMYGQIYDPTNTSIQWGPLGEIKYMYNKTESHYAVLTLNAMQLGQLSVRKMVADHNVSIKQGNGWSVLTANPLQVITFKSGWDADSIIELKNNINYPDNMIFVYLPNDSTTFKPDDYVVVDYYGNVCNSFMWAKLKLWWQVISRQLDRNQVGIKLDCYINALSY